MKLYFYENSNHTLFLPESFSGLLVKRLFVVEAVSAIMYKPLESVHFPMMAPNYVGKKCKQRKYNDTQTASAIAILNEIANLSQLIQVACFLEWNSQSEQEIKKRGLMSAKRILPTFRDKDQQKSINTYVVEFTDKIIDSLAHPDIVGDLSHVQTALTVCFPSIDQSKLKQCMQAMTEQIEQLKTPTPLSAKEIENDDEMDGDLVMIKSESVRFFGQAPSQEPTAKPHSCTIS